ncbi:MAG: SUMF1/EgtB/PvdO family nonheme iron enzyme [Polyangiaceae bacterium]|nr:SUMF1/EgtB/PvdO family nonheme iron enzyme [Polyangiaceae bacterium]
MKTPSRPARGGGVFVYRRGARGLSTCAAALLSILGACKESEPEGPTKPEPSSAPEQSAAKPTEPLPNTASCPEEMVNAGGYCIDKYEAHLVRVDSPETVLPHFEHPKRKVKYMARSRAGIAPQAYINRMEAARACKAAGKRLCSAREWYGACAGSRGTRYPYGDEEVAGVCNTGKTHLMQKLFGPNVKYTYAAHYNSPRLHKEPGFLAKSGEYDGCVSDYGVYDMVGNLHEWVADDVSRKLLKEVPVEFGPELLGPKGSGAFIGGYFSSQGEHGRGCAYLTATHSPDYHDYSIGFRCCAGELGEGEPR